MDFYITVSSGPTSDIPGNQTSWTEYNLKEAIELEGQYEVALVQSVFKDMHTVSLATINILSSDFGMEVNRFQMLANDGDDAETIIKNLNQKMLSKFKDSHAPYFKLDNETLEFEIELPYEWDHLIIDVDTSNLSQSQEKFKFKNNKYNHPRHFYVFSNLIDYQITGNTMHPLLSNFCLSDFHSIAVAYSPNNPRYVRVKENLIKNFNIEYSPSIYSGNQLSGEIISTLHFRKKNGF